jgi:hypothetical protein
MLILKLYKKRQLRLDLSRRNKLSADKTCFVPTSQSRGLWFESRTGHIFMFLNSLAFLPYGPEYA